MLVRFERDEDNFRAMTRYGEIAPGMAAIRQEVALCIAKRRHLTRECRVYPFDDASRGGTNASSASKGRKCSMANR